MKIDMNMQGDQCHLSSLEEGDAFHHDNNLYIKTDEADRDQAKVVNLDTGYLDTIDLEAKVTPARVKVVPE